MSDFYNLFISRLYWIIVSQNKCYAFVAYNLLLSLSRIVHMGLYCFRFINRTFVQKSRLSLSTSAGAASTETLYVHAKLTCPRTKHLFTETNNGRSQSGDTYKWEELCSDNSVTVVWAEFFVFLVQLIKLTDKRNTCNNYLLFYNTVPQFLCLVGFIS